jgi:polyphosphate kinase
MTSTFVRPVQSDARLRWLDFGECILTLTQDEDTPLIERVRLSAISSGLLDEFFAITAAPQRHELSASVRALVAQTDEVLHNRIVPALAENGPTIVRWDEATDLERDELGLMFRRWIKPMLTPLTVDATHPFPYVGTLSLNLAVLLRDGISGRERFAQLTVPPLVPHLVAVGRGRFVPVEEVVGAHLSEIFVESQVVATHCFRVTRSRIADSQHIASTTTAPPSKGLHPRRFGTPVRLEVDAAMTPRVTSDWPTATCIGCGAHCR